MRENCTENFKQSKQMKSMTQCKQMDVYVIAMMMNDGRTFISFRCRFANILVFIVYNNNNNTK